MSLDPYVPENIAARLYRNIKLIYDKNHPDLERDCFMDRKEFGTHKNPDGTVKVSAVGIQARFSHTHDYNWVHSNTLLGKWVRVGHFGPRLVSHMHESMVEYGMCFLDFELSDATDSRRIKVYNCPVIVYEDFVPPQEEAIYVGYEMMHLLKMTQSQWGEPIPDVINDPLMTSRIFEEVIRSDTRLFWVYSPEFNVLFDMWDMMTKSYTNDGWAASKDQIPIMRPWSMQITRATTIPDELLMKMVVFLQRVKMQVVAADSRMDMFLKTQKRQYAHQPFHDRFLINETEDNMLVPRKKYEKKLIKMLLETNHKKIDTSEIHEFPVMNYPLGGSVNLTARNDEDSDALVEQLQEEMQLEEPRVKKLKIGSLDVETQGGSHVYKKKKLKTGVPAPKAVISSLSLKKTKKQPKRVRSDDYKRKKNQKAKENRLGKRVAKEVMEHLVSTIEEEFVEQQKIEDMRARLKILKERNLEAMLEQEKLEMALLPENHQPVRVKEVVLETGENALELQEEKEPWNQKKRKKHLDEWLQNKELRIKEEKK